MKLSAAWKDGMAVMIFILAAFGLYSNTLGHAFHFDDFIFIVQNPELRNPFDILTVWNEGSAPTRFVVYWTFAWNYYFHQYDVTGYHVVNILIHGINTGLVYLLTRTMAERTGQSNGAGNAAGRMAALAAAVVFLCHPLQTQAVTYLCQRFASLAAMFYLTAVWCYWRGRVSANGRGGWWAAAVLAGLLGMFTKQIVLTLPAAVLLTEWMFFRDARVDGRGLLRQWKILAAAGVLCFIIPAVYKFNMGILLREYESLSHRGDTLNAGSYFLTQTRVIWTYLRLLVWPSGQNLLYDFPASYHWWDAKVMAGFAGIAVLIGAALRWRRVYPLAAFGVLWFFVTLAVESTVIPIRHVIFEHRVYLPMFGFALVAAELIGSRRRAAVILVIILTMGTVLSVLTYRRNAVWRDGVTLWSDVLKKSPGLIRPYTHLATAYLNQGEYQQALDVYSRAIAVDPQRAESYNNRGNVYAATKRLDLALADYHRALELDPTLEKTYNNVGTIYNQRKDFEQALVHYDRALDLNPSNAGAYFNRANVYLQKNELDKAFTDYSRSIEKNPFQKKAYYYRAQIYAQRGEYEHALQDIREAQTLGVKVDPGFVREVQQRLKP